MDFKPEQPGYEEEKENEMDDDQASGGGSDNVPEDVKINAELGQDIPAESPILLRSRIAQLRGHVEKRILVSNEFTWAEFIDTWCEFELDPKIHLVRGTANRELDLDSKIGDYIGTFRRQSKVYPIRVEIRRKSSTAKKPACEKLQEKPVVETNIETDTDDEDIPVVPGCTHEAGGGDQKTDDDDSGEGGDVQMEVGNCDVVKEDPKEDDGNWCDVNESNGPTPNKQREDEDVKDVKRSMVEFLRRKVKDKDLWKIRRELMAIKAKQDYFNLTAVAPLGAGLLEQMFCFRIPEEDLKYVNE